MRKSGVVLTEVYQLWARLSITGSTYFGGKVEKTEDRTAEIGESGYQVVDIRKSGYQASRIKNPVSRIAYFSVCSVPSVAKDEKLLLCGFKQSRILSAVGCSMTPFSVMMAAMSRASVTSNAGL